MLVHDVPAITQNSHAGLINTNTWAVNYSILIKHLVEQFSVQN